MESVLGWMIWMIWIPLIILWVIREIKKPEHIERKSELPNWKNSPRYFTDEHLLYHIFLRLDTTLTKEEKDIAEKNYLENGAIIQPYSGRKFQTFIKK